MQRVQGLVQGVGLCWNDLLLLQMVDISHCHFIKQTTAALGSAYVTAIDYTIYTRNRCFRCPYSYKARQA
jgi:hypothetical protein